MKKKPLHINHEQNKKRERIIFRLLTIISILVVIAVFFTVWNLFVRDLYTAFVLNFIIMSLLYATALSFCLFFLYCFFVITVLNPQRLKKLSIIKFALGGVLTLIITIGLLIFSGTDTIKSILDMKDYANGEWQVKDLLVLDVYRGGSSRIVLIETSEGEMSLHRESFLLYVGQQYRFTYLDATNTIIKVERW